MAKTLTPKEFALALNTDARTARKFLRSVTPKDDQPGKGNRWTIEARSVKSLTTKFNAWNDARTAKSDNDDKPGIVSDDGTHADADD